jgi:hypothetical protein
MARGTQRSERGPAILFGDGRGGGDG